MTIGSSRVHWKSWVRKAVTLIDEEFPRLSWGTYNGHSPSISLAADGMVPDYKTEKGNDYGWRIARHLAQPSVARRLGIWYVIYDGKIWSMTRPSQGWLRYFNAGSSSDSLSHRNHIHISWYGVHPKLAVVLLPIKKVLGGGYPRPSARVVFVDRLNPGQQNSDSVWWVQAALGVKRTGDYDAATVAAVKSFQKSLGDPQDGNLGPLQTKALFNRVSRLNVRVEDKA